ncbi:MAG: site-specific DNA-methyltransferase, partial [Chloroflexota bacterium]|nr:site-specific DNA-methyltransferase [Chloroflexota bacterium]
MTNFADKTVWTGDNLDILRGLNSASVDLIYLDPPFNSNRNYAAPLGSAAAGAAFKDTWTLSDLDVAWMGLIADQHPAIYRVLDTAGLFHGKGMQSYLCMMAVRLLEMRRVMNDTASIYLHCDPTASHYLKLLMDAVFGAELFLNEMSWKRSSAHSDTRQGMRRAGKIRDVLLVYTKTRDYVWNSQYMPYTEDYLETEYRHVAPDGRRYKETDATAAKPGGDTEYQWHVKRPVGEKVRWSADLTDEHLDPQPGWEYRAVIPYRGRYWADSKANLSVFWNEGRLVHRETGMPRLMQFSEDMPGVPLQDLWDDIPPVLGNERIGYPTQKPLALLERIIRASSNEGQMVLDPFCGCATACVAADNLGRRWLGIDISPKAVELVNLRLRQSMGELFHNRLVTARTDIPRRTDIDAPVPYRQNKHVLFGQQEGRCRGCRSPFEFRHLEV